jgi:hypothetical protein
MIIGQQQLMKLWQVSSQQQRVPRRTSPQCIKAQPLRRTLETPLPGGFQIGQQPQFPHPSIPRSLFARRNTYLLISPALIILQLFFQLLVLQLPRQLLQLRNFLPRILQLQQLLPRNLPQMFQQHISQQQISQPNHQKQMHQQGQQREVLAHVFPLPSSQLHSILPHQNLQPNFQQR